MSVNYDVIEHLEVRNNFREATIINDIMCYQLSLLGSLMLLNEAEINKIELKTKEKEFSFDNGVSLTDLKAVLDTIPFSDDEDGNAAIDLYISYRYTWRIGRDALNVGPFVMTDYLVNLSTPDLGGVFYTMYNWADSGEAGDSGSVFAYGKKDRGWYHKGKIEYRPAESIPQGGTWYNQQSSVSYLPDSIEGKDISEIERVCNKLIAAFDPECSHFVRKVDDVDFYLNNTLLKGPREIEKFASLTGELIKLVGEDVYTLTEFVDLDGKDPRLMRIDFDKNGNASYFIAEV
jgi:hypothetical protein